MDGTYPKASGSAGSKGVKFQIDLLIVFLLNAIRQNIKGWKLSTENKQAGKFDDVVLESDDGAIVLQAKHKDNKKITSEQLNSTNSKRDDFSLPKYFLDYLDIKSRLPVKLMVICTNTRVDSKILNILNTNNVNEDSILYYQNGSFCYTFSDSIISDLLKNAKIYYENNSKEKDIDETLITENNAKEFLKHLQFHVGYPSGYDLEKSIEKLLSDLRRFNNLLRDISYRDLHQKIRDWFEQPKGDYLTESRTKVLFCEIISEKCCRKLANYNILFKNASLNITNSRKRIIHVVVEGGRLLHLLKIYQNLQPTAKILYVTSDYNGDVQKEIIKAFEAPPCSFLIIASSEFSSESSIIEICDLLQQILKGRDYKKVIFVAERNDKFVQQMKSTNDHDVFDLSLTLEDLLDDSQERILKKKSVIFQGEIFSLAELISQQTTDEYKKFVNADILEQIVRGEKLSIGMKLLDLDEEMSKYYVDRRFENLDGKVEKTGKEFSEEEISNISDKMILISDSAGMGKTTVLKKLAIRIKNSDNRLWVVRIELNRCTHLLSDCLMAKRTLNLLELLEYNSPTKVTVELETLLLSLTEILVVLLDGIDEVSPDYTDLILHLLQDSQNRKCLKNIFLTTRPHMAKRLQKRLDLTTFQLVPLTEPDQVDFFTKYWVNKLELDSERIGECKRYAKSLMNRVSIWIKGWSNDVNFVASPLHASILAAVFLENSGSDEWQGIREYLQTDDGEPKLPQKMKVGKLYEMFIEKKKEIFVRKGNAYGNNMANVALRKQFDDCLVYHRSLALKRILGGKKCSFFSRYECNSSDDDENTALKIGIVQKSSNELMFMHKTFAEYFVAESILEELRLGRNSLEFQELLIDCVLWEEEFQMVRRFFDNFLCHFMSSLSTDSFNNYISRDIDEDIHEDILHRQAAEGNTEIIRFLLKLIHFDFETVGRRQTSFVFFVKKNTLSHLKYMVDRDGLNMKNILGARPIHEAVKNRHLDTLKLLVELGADVESVEDCSPNDTALHIAAKSGPVDVVEFLVDRVADVDRKNSKGHTPLLCAVKLGGDDIAKLLIERGADINVSNNKGITLLHFAARRSNLDIFRFLVNHGANVHQANMWGQMGLHIAAEHGNFEMVGFVLKQNVDIDVPDNRGNTPLHFAVRIVNFKMTKFLVNLGADVNVTDKEGRTALHIAVCARNYNLLKFIERRRLNIIYWNNELVKSFVQRPSSKECLRMVKFFVKRSANINATDKNGNTALHFAASVGGFDVFKLLLENGADINLANNDGETVLHLAAERNNCDIVEHIFKHGILKHGPNRKGETVLSCGLRGSRVKKGDFLMDFAPYSYTIHNEDDDIDNDDDE